MNGWFTADDFIMSENDCSARNTAMVGKAFKKTG